MNSRIKATCYDSPTPEYDIDAELPLAEMEFRDTDTDLDKQLKLRMLEVYNKRLAERRARKAFVVDRGLLNVKKQQALERRRTSQEKEIHASVRVFARFLEPNEYEIMLEGLAAESRIRNRIAELKEQEIDCELILIGNKGITYFKKRETPVRKMVPCGQAPTAEQASAEASASEQASVAASVAAVARMVARWRTWWPRRGSSSCGRSGSPLSTSRFLGSSSVRSPAPSPSWACLLFLSVSFSLFLSLLAYRPRYLLRVL